MNEYSNNFDSTLFSFRTVFQGYISVRLERGQPGPGGDGGGAGRGHAAAPLHARGDGNCRDDDQVTAVCTYMSRSGSR